MTFSNLKILFLIAFLGTALIGCAKKDATVVEDEPVAAEPTKTIAPPQVVEPEKVVVIPTNAAGLTATQLLDTVKGKTIRFEFDRYEITPEFFALIKMHADYMSLTKSANITLAGHADERGTPEYNLALGERRGIAVKNALIAEGISPSRINVISFGEEKPVAFAQTEAAWAKNRRVELSY